jgi:hypothetical protein
VTNSNAQLEHLEADKKKGKLPSYQSERDYQLDRLMDNYGASGGFVSGFGCPKIPVMPPRQKKKGKGDDLPDYEGK